MNSSKCPRNGMILIRVLKTTVEDAHHPIVLNEVAPDHIVDYPSSLSHTKTYSDTMHPPAKAGFETVHRIFSAQILQSIYDDGKPVPPPKPGHRDHDLGLHSPSSKHKKVVLVDGRHEPHDTVSFMKLEDGHGSMSHMNALEGDETTHHVPSSRHDKSYSDDLHKPHETVSFMKLEDGHTSMSHMKALEGDETTHHVPSPRHDKSRMGKLHKPHNMVSLTRLEDGHTSMSHMNALKGDETRHHVPSPRHDKSYSENLYKPHDTVSFMKLEDGQDSISHMNALKGDDTKHHAPSPRHNKSLSENRQNIVKIRFLKFDDDAVRVEKMSHTKSADSHEIPFISPSHKPVFAHDRVIG